MVASPENWKNLPDQTTPITAEQLNRLESQAYTPEYISFTPVIPINQPVGTIYYNLTDDTFNVVHTNATQQIGEEIYIQFINSTGAIIPNGSLVGLTGIGTTVSLYNASGATPPMFFLGMVTKDVPIGARGRITQFGRVRNIDTSALASGVFYADPNVAGGITQVKPTAPNIVLSVGLIVDASASGQAFMRPVLENQRFFGTFYKTDSATLAAVNTPTPITLNLAGLANGVKIDPLNPTRIKVNQSGLYHFGVSFQLVETDIKVKDARLWFRKNGSDLANTTIVCSLDANEAKNVQSRTINILMNKDDYIELYWGAANTGVLLSALASNAWSPAAPSVVLNVNQVQQ